MFYYPPPPKQPEPLCPLPPPHRGNYKALSGTWTDLDEGLALHITPILAYFVSRYDHTAQGTGRVPGHTKLPMISPLMCPGFPTLTQNF